MPVLPDSFVRPAHLDDAGALGDIHVAAWRSAYASVLGDHIVAGFRPESFAESWRAALQRHEDGEGRRFLLVACAGDTVVGFVAGQPGADPDSMPTDGELTALLVDPGAGRGGHGSRLLSASADTCRDLGFDTVRAWVLDGDHSHIEFFTSAGFAHDGAWRETEIEPGRTVIERRYAAALG